jgi:hypothetical protein
MSAEVPPRPRIARLLGLIVAAVAGVIAFLSFLTACKSGGHH